MTTNTRNSSEKEQVYSGVFRSQYFLTFQVSRTGKKKQRADVNLRSSVLPSQNLGPPYKEKTF